MADLLDIKGQITHKKMLTLLLSPLYNESGQGLEVVNAP